PLHDALPIWDHPRFFRRHRLLLLFARVTARLLPPAPGAVVAEGRSPPDGVGGVMFDLLLHVLWGPAGRRAHRTDLRGAHRRMDRCRFVAADQPDPAVRGGASLKKRWTVLGRRSASSLKDLPHIDQS